MADHGDNYVRQKGEEGEEIGELSVYCGHHCGVITVGGKDKHIGHCACPECHDNVRIGGEQVPVVEGRDYPAIVRVGNTGRVPRVT
jgi:hypothetical protein